MKPEQPVRRRGFGAAVRRAAVFVLVLYAGWCGTLYFAQTALLFPRGMMESAPPEIDRPGDAEQWWVSAEDGSRVEGWFVRGKGRDGTDPGPCVIWLHGNGEYIDDNMQAARMYAEMGVSVLLPEYRGYGRSTGTPSQRAIMEDLERFHGVLLERPEVDARRIVYHGESIGTGFAAALAEKYPPRAMILNSPFLSLAGMAGRSLVPEFFVRSPLRSDEVLRHAVWPVLIFHGTHDRVVPVQQGRALADLTPGATFVELECGHNDLPPDPIRYAGRVRAFLESAGVLSGGNAR